jgi:dolichyl-phosphate beta-glucosyltransferase
MGDSPDPHLSVIVPAYDEAARLPATLDELLAWAAGRPFPVEVLVADDGSTDGTGEVVSRRAASDPRLHLLRSERNRGKGDAVGRGVAAARGDAILFTDADLSTPLRFYDDLAAALGEADVAIASRAHPDSRIPRRQPWYRQGMGRGFNVLVRWIVGGDLRDTQCGFKLFRRDAAKRLFALRRIDGFAFDVEILHLAHRMGLRVREVPVDWYNDEASRVHVIRHSTRMFLDLVRIRWLHREW